MLKSFSNTKLKPKLGVLVKGTITAISVFTCFSTSAFAQTSKVYNIEGFKGIKAEAGISVEMKTADTFSVKASFPEGYEELIIVRKSGNALYVGRQTKNGWADGNGKVVIQVTAPSLSFLEANSGGRIRADVDALGKVKVKAFSGGRIAITGSCEQLTAQAASGGAADLSDLPCDRVSAKSYSGGGLKVHALETIRTRTDSAGNVIVFGNPPNRDVKESKGAYDGRTTFKTE